MAEMQEMLARRRAVVRSLVDETFSHLLALSDDDLAALARRLEQHYEGRIPRFAITRGQADG